MKVVSTLIGPPPTAPGQLCPCNPVNGAPLGGAGEPGADITGHLTDYSGNPIPDICIELSYVTEPVAYVRTDATGTWHYKFPGLGAHPSMYLTYTECQPRSPGWDFAPPFFTMYSFNSGLTITIDVQAQRAVAVTGLLVNALGQPLPNTPVAAAGKGNDGFYAQNAKTDASGRFSFFGFSAGSVEVGYFTPIAGTRQDFFGRGSVIVVNLTPGEIRTVTVPTT